MESSTQVKGWKRGKREELKVWTQKIQNFVSLAMVQPFDVLVGNDHQQVNGQSFIGMFSLDYTRPLQVRVNCSEEQFSHFCKAASETLA